MFDWQLIIVLLLIAGSAAYAGLRVVRLFRRRSGGANSCAGSCHGCSPQSESPLVSLDATGHADRS